METAGLHGMQRLGAQDQVQREPEEAREDEQRPGVGLPALGDAGIDAQDAIGEAFQRPSTGLRNTRSPVKTRAM